MSNKPAKPYKDFPLFPHASRQWAKKIRGKIYYFGVWDDADAALQNYEAVRDDLFAGRTPRPNSTGLTLGDLCAKFRTAKDDLAASGEIAQHTCRDYHESSRWLEEYFGPRRLVSQLSPDDFSGLRRHIVEKKNQGLHALGSHVSRIRCVFKFGYDQDLIDRPVKFGQVFRKPSKLSLRRQRQEKPTRMFTPDQLLELIGPARTQLRAMILLGINCGFGNNDCAKLQINMLDLERGWVNYPRPKTGINRRCPLWPESVKAIRDVLAARNEPKDKLLKDQVFITKFGLSWERLKSKSNGSPVADRFYTLLKRLNLRREGLSFYKLRHVFETVGGSCRDQVAVNSIMGHADSSMAATYRETVDDSRLRAVADTVRGWLGVEKLAAALNTPAPSANDGPGSRAA